jgi:hypothetical protein
MVLLFLIPMTNIAYPWLMQNAIVIQLWPFAIAVGTMFMFLMIAAIGECARWLGGQIREIVRKE